MLDLLCAVGMGCWMVAASSEQQTYGTKRLLECSALVGAGRFSYSLYLIHAPVLQLVWLYAVRPWFKAELSQFMAMVLYGIPTALAMAYLFFGVAERPFLCKRAGEHTLDLTPLRGRVGT
jgi:peptidoglycan/LPS O-acetylase OafA/YrhL